MLVNMVMWRPIIRRLVFYGLFALLPSAFSQTDLPSLEQMYLKAIVLKGVVTSGGRRLAIINGRSFEKGEQGKINIRKGTVSVHCQEIKDKSVVILIEGISQPKEIALH